MPPISRPLLAAAVAASAFAAPAFAKDEYPFIGKWDCGVGVFTFTDKIYNNGSEDLEIRKIEEDGGAYTLTFADDYVIAVSVDGDTMNWMSLASGDGFECKKVK
jgi:hypothetical protein